MAELSVSVDDDVVLHVEVHGPSDAPPLVLLNGAFCTVRSWDLTMPMLEQSFRVIRHDVRGTGRSSAGPSQRYTFEQYADDTVAICDHLGVPAAHLWGMAWGARVALVAAARHGERFASVMLADLAIDPADPAAQRDGVAAAKRARAAAAIDEVNKPHGWNEHRDIEETKRALEATVLHTDLMPFVRRVSAEVFIATGDHDPNLASSRRAFEGFSNARLEVVPHTAHGAVLQHPQMLAHLATSFFLGASSQ